jgi:hypothetical protein
MRDITDILLQVSLHNLYSLAFHHRYCLLEGLSMKLSESQIAGN